jgi:hypothetical protein
MAILGNLVRKAVRVCGKEENGNGKERRSAKKEGMTLDGCVDACATDVVREKRGRAHIVGHRRGTRHGKTKGRKIVLLRNRLLDEHDNDRRDDVENADSVALDGLEEGREVEAGEDDDGEALVERGVEGDDETVDVVLSRNSCEPAI